MNRILLMKRLVVRGVRGAVIAAAVVLLGLNVAFAD